ncbi:choline dehydrogenase-like flavoprotein [Bradyrhizobium sp. GM22.5]
MPAGHMPTCCPISTARRTTPIFDGAYHGKGGPLHVNRLRADNPIHDIFHQAAREAQFRIREDFNEEDHEGLGSYQVTQHNGERWSAARAYLHPHMDKRANLRVETQAHATRILFESGRAVGIEYVQGKQTKKLRARREVILASGAFQSPQLLMLSGIGDGKALAAHGIDVVHHLPGVGRNLQDHPDFVFVYASDYPHFVHSSLGRLPSLLRAIQRYRRERRGLMTTNFAECGGFLKTRADLDVPDIQLHFIIATLDDHGRKKHKEAGFSCHVCLLRPKSRGSVWLKSADPLAAPLIDPNFLGEAEDLETMVAGFKTTRRLMETPAMRALQKKDMFTSDVRTDDDIRAILRARVDTRLSPRRHLQDGHRRDGRGRSGAEGARRGRSARRRRLDHADTDRRQHQCAGDHDRREGGGYDQGRDAVTLPRRPGLVRNCAWGAGTIAASQFSKNPPSTVTTLPVMYREAFEASSRIAPSRSDSAPMRRWGMRLVRRSPGGVAQNAWFISVSM